MKSDRWMKQTTIMTKLFEVVVITPLIKKIGRDTQTISNDLAGF